ncbi:MAG: peptidylprolyl isomerase [Candidatus Micrarchaeota archaeon]|nr:peptidylprolyl isomerase [Candidatus Micrarchaeota archaeon]MDE1859334.1 peptidylprolyl isomerase [Candidatus Micrarchaeota archaeon]
MSFKDGEFVKIDYTAKKAADNSFVYTTMEKVAKDSDAFSEETRYIPQLVVLGKNNAIKGVEDAVKGMAVGETKTVQIEPRDAFGERDEKLVNVMRLSDFRERDMNPVPGMQVNIDGRIATVKSVNSGRVIVDMNHPLAGEKLLYEIKVLAKLDADADKVKALAESYSLTPDNVIVEGKAARIRFGEKVEKNADFLVNKAALADAILRFMPNVDKVIAEEEYTRTAPEKEKAAK